MNVKMTRSGENPNNQTRDCANTITESKLMRVSFGDAMTTAEQKAEAPIIAKERSHFHKVARGDVNSAADKVAPSHPDSTTKKAGNLNLIGTKRKHSTNEVSESKRRKFVKSSQQRMLEQVCESIRSKPHMRSQLTNEEERRAYNARLRKQYHRLHMLSTDGVQDAKRARYYHSLLAASESTDGRLVRRARRKSAAKDQRLSPGEQETRHQRRRRLSNALKQQKHKAQPATVVTDMGVAATKAQ